jgi:hypothetical protein
VMKALDRQCPQSGVGAITNKFVLKCNVFRLVTYNQEGSVHCVQSLKLGTSSG